MDKQLQNQEQLIQTLSKIRSSEGDMTLVRLCALLIVHSAGNEGIPLAELRRRLNASASNLTKIVQSWSALTHDKKEGPDYIRAELDPMDLSHKIVRITEKGRLAVASLLGESKTANPGQALNGDRQIQDRH